MSRKPALLRITGKHPNECPECEGFGYTNDTATEWWPVEEVKPKTIETVSLGSGCPRCCGTGRIES